MQHRTRISERFVCNIPVLACDTLENHPARIVDLSLHGAKVHSDHVWPAGSSIHLDLEGDWVWGIVQWAEIDRMGVKFVSALAPNSTLGRLLSDSNRPAPLPQTAARGGGFGRRIAA